PGAAILLTGDLGPVGAPIAAALARGLEQLGARPIVSSGSSGANGHALAGVIHIAAEATDEGGLTAGLQALRRLDAVRRSHGVSLAWRVPPPRAAALRLAADALAESTAAEDGNAGNAGNTAAWTSLGWGFPAEATSEPVVQALRHLLAAGPGTQRLAV